jgi:hypothetical protein
MGAKRGSGVCIEGFCIRSAPDAAVELGTACVVRDEWQIGG